MSNHLVPLQPGTHSGLRLQPVPGHAFASQETFIPIIIDEIGQVAREYPIVFLGKPLRPVALLGVEAGRNAYVAPDGRWLAQYLPALLRHYPFALRPLPEPAAAEPETARIHPAGQPRLALMIDDAAPCLSTTTGTPLFDGQGQLSAAIQQIAQQIQRDTLRLAATRKLVASIGEAGLLVERRITLRAQDGSERPLGGLHTIDEKALNRLDHAAFARLRDSGALPLIYASLLSWSNFQLGPIGRSHPLPPTTPAPSATPPATPSFLDGDTIRF